jgi:DNA-binding LytR/AlgR family response regulator
MKVIIIEDEKLNAEHLINMLKRINDKVEIVACLESVKKSIDLFNNKPKADLIFMDIYLADGLSFEILNSISIEIPIIFTTAYNEYALKAFKYNSVDYLLKPVDINELTNAIDKLNRLQSRLNQFTIENIFDAFNKEYKKRFLVKSGEHIQSIKVEEINNFFSEEGYTFVNYIQNKKYIIDYTLDQLEELLDPNLFFRLNRQSIVNINSINKISTYLNSRLKISAQNLPEDYSIISRERVVAFKSWLDK